MINVLYYLRNVYVHYLWYLYNNEYSTSQRTLTPEQCQPIACYSFKKSVSKICTSHNKLVHLPMVIEPLQANELLWVGNKRIYFGKEKTLKWIMNAISSLMAGWDRDWRDFSLVTDFECQAEDWRKGMIGGKSNYMPWFYWWHPGNWEENRYIWVPVDKQLWGV